MTLKPPAAPLHAASADPGWVSSVAGEWLRIIDNRIGLRVVRFRGVFHVTATDGIVNKQPTAVFCQSGSVALPEAMEAAEVLGEALRMTLDRLAQRCTAPR